MKKQIIISSDSTCDLSSELIERYNIRILPMGVTLGDNSYRDGVDVTPDDLYAYVAKTGQLPKTSAINMAENADYFEELTRDGSAVIHFTISASMSATYNNARMAAEDFEDVYVVDAKNLSTGSGLLVLAAAEMAQQGMEAGEIAQKVSELADYVDASFVVDNLEYLAKGGRCSAVAAFGANLLQLKPCISVKNGAMGVGKKYRGKFEKVLPTYVSERLADGEDIELDRVFVTHAGCDPQLVESIAELVKNTLPFKEVLVTRAGCTVSSHCGANTLGVLFVRKTPLN
jgi:DegV family protein with EDD domain